MRSGPSRKESLCLNTFRGIVFAKHTREPKCNTSINRKLMWLLNRPAACQRYDTELIQSLISSDTLPVSDARNKQRSRTG